MSDLYGSVIGSGTIANIQHGPAHNVPVGTFPVPPKSQSLRTRQGEGIIVLNPEDFSVNIGVRSQAITVTTSPTPLPLNPLEYRRALAIHNNGNSTIFIGDDTVTVAQGFPILAGEKIAFDVGNVPNVTIYAIAGSSTNVRIMELA